MVPRPTPLRRAWTRRDLLQLGVGFAAGLCFAPYEALAAPERKRLKITRIQAMAIKNIAGNCLIRIDTDQGPSGYGEAGCTGPMARARIETMKGLLLGRDPLAIQVHFHNMTTLMHTYMAHIPTISGIDIALWDLAGKILNQPVCRLLGGPFRDAIPLYSHGNCNLLDPGSCRAWVEQVQQQPEGFTAFKIGPDGLVGNVAAGRFNPTLSGAQLQRVARGFANLREAAGDQLDLGVHCHNEYDTPSAIGIAKAVEPMRPMFLEDPLSVPYCEGWLALKRSARVPILTGEKLELVRGFKPFLDHQAVDFVHPDLAFAGGITGTRQIADYAALSRTPLALHNVGSLVLCCASAHFGAAIQSFFRSESALGRPQRYVERMARSNPPLVRNGMLSVPEGPGLGLDLDEDFLRKNLAPGEPYWS